MRTSDYIIYVKLPNCSGYLIVHGYTGAVDLVSSNVVAFLKRGDATAAGGSSLLSQPSGATIDKLRTRGYITERSSCEERQFVSQLSSLIHNVSCRRSSFSFFVAYDCDFDCPYCFQRDRLQSDLGWSKMLISRDSVSKAYRAMYEINPIRAFHDNRIMLVGGEPLMIENHEIVSYIIEKGLSEGYTFGAITNGYWIDRFVSFIQPGMIDFLQVTLDGDQYRHDTLRRHRSGAGTFERIMRNIDLAIDSGATVSVRINVPGSLLDDLHQLNDEFVRRGWCETGRFSAYRARIRDRVKRENALGKSGLRGKRERAPSDHRRRPGQVEMCRNRSCEPHTGIDSLRSREERLAEASREHKMAEVASSGSSHDYNADGPFEADRYIAQSVDIEDMRNKFSHIAGYDRELRMIIVKMLRDGAGLPFRMNFCGAMNGMIVFEPYGRIYTCLETVGLHEFSVGTCGARICVDKDKIESLWRGSLYDSGCHACKYLFFCGRGCPVHSIFQDKIDRAEVCREFPPLFKQILVEEFMNLPKQ